MILLIPRSEAHIQPSGHTIRDGGRDLVKCTLRGKVHEKFESAESTERTMSGHDKNVEDQRRHTVATSQSGWTETWKQSCEKALDGKRSPPGLSKHIKQPTDADG